MPGKKKHHVLKKGHEEKVGKPETGVREEAPDSSPEQTDGLKKDLVPEVEKKGAKHKPGEEGSVEKETNSPENKEGQPDHPKHKTKPGPHKK